VNLEEKIYVLNGAYGTFCRARGWLKGIHLAELNLKNPQAVSELYSSYERAGCDIITTNTFQANRLRLRTLGLEAHFEKINEEALRLAKETNCIVAGGIGPTGEYLAPLGDLSFDRAYEIFAEQASLLKGADLILIETFTDIKEAKAAVIAAKETLDVPIICTMAFEEGGRTATGTDVETAISILTSAGTSIIGANCGVSLEEMYEIAKIFSEKSTLPLLIKPNAGIPKIVDGEAVFSETPQRMAMFAKKFAELGVNIIGGCCGNTPEHMKEVSSAVAGITPVKRSLYPKTTLSSRTKTIEIGEDLVIVGERINPTGKEDLKSELKEGKTSLIRKEALAQVKEGAHLLDVNVSIPSIDAVALLPKAINAVQSAVGAPISIDTPNTEALEAALKQSDGKPLINSTTGEREKMEIVFSLAKKYGAAVIGLTLDERGLPKTAGERVEIAKKIIDFGSKYIPKEDIIIDCLVRTTGAEQEQAIETLNALKEIEQLGVKTILGVSNVSHGLPNRPLLNATFLEMAKVAGLDVAIYNPHHLSVEPDELARKVLLNEDKGALEYIKANVHIEEKEPVTKELSLEDELKNAILEGDDENIVGLVEKALRSKGPMEINALLVSAMDVVGRKFKNNEYFLPQVMLSASAMKNAFSRLKNEIKQAGGSTLGKILFATVKNDVHDIGKNIVTALFEANNFEVIDLGADVPSEEITAAVFKNSPDLLCLSSLMTTTIVEIPKVIAELKKNDIDISVLIGGAVVTGEYAEEVGAHYAKDAVDAVELAKSLI